MKNFLRICLLACSLAMSVTGTAQTERFGDYVVYYSVVNSTFVTAEIASQYGITRAERGAFLNISVQQSGDSGQNVPVTATITGEKRNMLQQYDTIDFREIREGSAIYYIGEFEFSNAEPVHFSLEILPEGADDSFTLEWNTRVYIN